MCASATLAPCSKVVALLTLCLWAALVFAIFVSLAPRQAEARRRQRCTRVVQRSRP
jgi:hypothetical protein